MRFSERFPRLMPLCVALLRVQRHLHWLIKFQSYATTRAHELLAHRVTTHQSLLMRKLGNADMRLQKNKITNLSLAIPHLHMIIIRPGETLSLWRLIGKPTAKKGYLEGLQLSNGEVKTGIGGGLCQLANLIFWMTLHTPLTVTERYHHSFDAFPDSGRVLPFGTGATLFYNYIDLQITNTTDTTYQVLVWLTDEHLKGEIRADRPPSVRYHIREEDHRYLHNEATNEYFRANTVLRDVYDATTGVTIQTECLMKNMSRMKYLPPEGAPLHSFVNSAGQLP